MMYIKKILFLIIITSSILIIVLGVFRFMFSTPSSEKNILKIISNDNEIIYFGDSVLNADHKNINTPSSMVNIFQERIGKEVLEISGTAFTPFMYDKYFDVIKKYSAKTKLVIIPINMRAFSSAWNKVPEYQFEQECALLSIILMKPNIFCLKEHLKNKYLSDYFNNKKEAFLNSPINAKGFLKNTKNYFLEKFKHICQIEKTNDSKSNINCEKQEYVDQIFDYMQHGLSLKQSITAMRYNYNYAESIISDNISLLSMKSLIKKAENSDIKILFYVTPVDLDNIMKFSGKKAIDIILSNLTLLQNNSDGKNIYFLNLLDLLESSYFDISCTCEHIESEGKKILINKVTEFIVTKIGNI